MTNTDPLISDEEIALYTTGPSAQANDYLAAAACAQDIAAMMARRVAMSAGGTSVQLNQQAEAFERLAKRLRTQSLRLVGVAGFAGGISITDKSTREEDSDSVVPFFTREQGDPISSALQADTDGDDWR